MKILMTGNTTFKLANFREGLIRHFTQEGHALTVLAPFDAHVDKLRDLCCETVDLPMDRKGASIPAELKLLRRFHREFKARKPDVIFSYTIKNNIYGALAARIFKIAFVPNVTGLGTAFETKGLFNKAVVTLYRIAFRRVPVVFFQNDHDRDLFLAAGIVRDDQVRMLPGSGVDLVAFQAAPLPGMRDAPVFLLIARLLRDKGIAEFVAAAQTLKAEHPNARFQLLGPLDNDSRVAIDETQLATWQADGIVDYLGAVRDVRPLIAAADCVVLPSYYREGTPRALLEAAAMGRPIITTDMPGCRDTVEDGTTGFLCSPRDTESLTDAMRRLIEMTVPSRQALGTAGRAKAERQFDERIVIDAYQHVLETLAIEAG